MPTQTAHAFCLEGRMHRFNLWSGWCEQGCGVRDDGRQVSLGGTEITPAPEPEAPALFTTDDRNDR